MIPTVSLLADILLGCAAIAAGLYCARLGQRLSRFSSTDSGVGGAIAALSTQVEDLKAAMAQTATAGGDEAARLAQLTQEAAALADRLDLILAGCHDLTPPADAPSSLPNDPPSNMPQQDVATDDPRTVTAPRQPLYTDVTRPTHSADPRAEVGERTTAPPAWSAVAAPRSRSPLRDDPGPTDPERFASVDDPMHDDAFDDMGDDGEDWPAAAAPEPRDSRGARTPEPSPIVVQRDPAEVAQPGRGGRPSSPMAALAERDRAGQAGPNSPKFFRRAYPGADEPQDHDPRDGDRFPTRTRGTADAMEASTRRRFGGSRDTRSDRSAGFEPDINGDWAANEGDPADTGRQRLNGGARRDATGRDRRPGGELDRPPPADGTADRAPHRPLFRHRLNGDH